MRHPVMHLIVVWGLMAAGLNVSRASETERELK